MTVARARALGVMAAAACATTLAMTPAIQSGVRTLIAEVGLVDNVGFIMGGTGNPLPGIDYLNSVETHYLSQFLGHSNPADNYTFQALYTPEQACPIICDPPPGEPALNLGDSINAGVGDLRQAIDGSLTDVNHVAVLGYSQSAIVAGQVMNQLIDEPAANLGNLHVTLLADPTSPIGGILDRFQFPDGIDGAPQHLPFLNVPLSLDPTPTSGIAADSYIGEYDGYANFPLDPSNISADINALIGIETVHPYYPDPDPTTNLDISPGGVGAIDLGTIGDTTYHAIFAPLPTLAFMYDGGDAGRFFYDAFNPFATLTDDWAYGNPGDPGAGVPADGIVAGAGPWQVDATGQLMASGVAGFDLKMDPLQMLAGMEYAGAESIIKPINDLLADAGQSPLPQSFVDSLLSGYEATNQLDASLLAELTTLSASIPSLAPDVLFDGSPAISAQPLIDLVGYGFDAFNSFGA